MKRFRAAMTKVLERDPTILAARFFQGIFQEYWVVLGAAFFFLVVAYGFQAFNHTMADDEWWTFQKVHPQFLWSVQIGRWVAPLIWAALEDGYVAPTFTIALLIVSFLLTGFFAARTIGLAHRFALFAFICTFALFPFWAEMVNFKLLHSTFSFGLLLSAASAALMWRAFVKLTGASRRIVEGATLVVVAAVCLSLVTSTYQGLIQCGPMIYVTAVLNRCILSGARPITRGDASAALLVLFLSLVVGTVLYVLEVWGIRSWFGVSDTDAQGYRLLSTTLNNFDYFRASVATAVRYIEAFLFQGNQLFPREPKVVFAFAVLILLAAGRNELFGSSLSALAGLFCLCAIALAPWVIGLIRGDGNAYRYVALTSASFIYGAAFGLANEHCKLPVLRAVLRIGTIFVIIVFCFQQNMAMLVTFENNRRDLAITNRILYTIESLPGYANIDRSNPVQLVVSGELANNHKKPFATTIRDSRLLAWSAVDCGLYDCSYWSIAAGLNLLGFTSFDYQVSYFADLNDSQKQRFASLFKAMPSWPFAGSISFPDELPNTLLIKLGETK
jgi:hypothetical protein